MLKKIGIIFAFLLTFALGIMGGAFFFPHHPDHNGITPSIHPTIYICGSSGDISSMSTMVHAMVNDPQTHAKEGLKIVVDTENHYSLKVTGKIDARNSNPTIQIGMVKGTNNSQKYENALKAVMTYLGKHYNVAYVNILGYSAGGGGTYRYLIQYSWDRTLPPVKKFVALDGQFNACTAQPDQTLAEVLKEGPKIKTKYYKFWEENYQRVNPKIQFILLEGDNPKAKESDGTVPFADAFSLNYLLQKNGNPVSYYLIKGNNTSHTEMPSNFKAIDYIKVFFYE